MKKILYTRKLESQFILVILALEVENELKKVLTVLKTKEKLRLLLIVLLLRVNLGRGTCLYQLQGECFKGATVS